KNSCRSFPVRAPSPRREQPFGAMSCLGVSRLTTKRQRHQVQGRKQRRIRSTDLKGLEFRLQAVVPNNADSRRNSERVSVPSPPALCSPAHDKPPPKTSPIAAEAS